MTTAFTPSAHELQVLQLASPFAAQIYAKHQGMADGFLACFGFERTLDEVQFDALVARSAYSGAAVLDDMPALMAIAQNIKDSRAKNTHENAHTLNALAADLSGDWASDDLTDLTAGIAADEAVIMKGLRKLRAMLMLKWIWQDALGVISLEALTFELSAFANSCIRLAHRVTFARLAQRFGVPMIVRDGKREPDALAVIAMGKLGAMELNLSSDIDLVFIHRGDGETDISHIGKKSVDNQKFMLNLGRGIIKLLDDVTADGFVFRVDMRLRPWGDGSPLVMTIKALEKYFNQHGRTWERFAWLKARVVNAVPAPFSDNLSNITKNFVHRYYIDYSAFGALREMKSMIMSQQAQRQDLDNVKLGVGGIRDIEFIVQAFALIYGGHHITLGEKRACLDGMAELAKLGYLDKDESDNLAAAYRFLRRLEHAIQARHDQQTQRLPQDENELFAIAKTLGFDDVAQFRQTLAMHRQNVCLPFERMVTDRQSPAQAGVDMAQTQAELKTLLSQNSLDNLQEFWQSKLVKGLESEAKSRLEAAYPIILHALLEHAKQDGSARADLAVPRLIALLEAICRRSIYLVMIAENPNATVGLIPMLSASPWIAKELAHYPMLLDNFLQKRYLHLPDKAELTDILRQSLLRVEAFDDESYLAAIRLFKKSQVLAVATADILGIRHIMKVSDSLTFIAAVVLQSALVRAFDELSAKHGFVRLQSGERASAQNMGFAIVGYGKLGGLEMSYSSDLDVVFLHQIDEQAETDGAKPVSGMKFAARLVQKILTYLSTQTRDGRVYELDMRLRPSGNAGVMVVSTHAFEMYQNDKAWAWEHQALVRSRGICGDQAVLAEFDRIRQAVLTKPRDESQVRSDVIEMRRKMQTHLGTKDSADKETHQFHIKQDFGGLVDIEFLAQFMVLSYAHAYPNLAIWPDNVRIFEEVAKAGLWQQARCEALTNAYLDLRKATHELALSEKQVVVDDEAWQNLREFVRGVWTDVLGDGVS